MNLQAKGKQVIIKPIKEQSSGMLSIPKNENIIKGKVVSFGEEVEEIVSDSVVLYANNRIDEFKGFHIVQYNNILATIE